MPMKLSLGEACNKANIFLGLIKYELNVLSISHLVDYRVSQKKVSIKSFMQEFGLFNLCQGKIDINKRLKTNSITKSS